MCAVSAVGDYFRDNTLTYKYPTYPDITRNEFDELKKDVEELKKLVIAAKRYDTEVGEPDCEVDEKVKLIREVAEMVGVNIKDVL